MTKVIVKGWKSFAVEGMEAGAIASVIEDALIGAKATVTAIRKGPKPKAAKALSGDSETEGGD